MVASDGRRSVVVPEKTRRKLSAAWPGQRVATLRSKRPETLAAPLDQREKPESRSTAGPVTVLLRKKVGRRARTASSAVRVNATISGLIFHLAWAVTPGVASPFSAARPGQESPCHVARAFPPGGLSLSPTNGEALDPLASAAAPLPSLLRPRPPPHREPPCPTLPAAARRLHSPGPGHTTAAAASSAPPVTGSVLPGLAAVDPAMLGLLGKHACPGPQLAVAGRGYGFADRAPHAPATLGARLPTCGTSRHAART